MIVQIEESWQSLLKDEFEKDYFKNLIQFVKKEYQSHTCYPAGGKVFSAFNQCPVDKVKVVIIGQDPYHGPNQANGLCFSVNNGVAIPASLKNIFKEIENDVSIPYPVSGNLEPWAKQGVLMLNATLTVRAHQAGSHQRKGWEKFTDAVIEKLSQNTSNVVFLLWGGMAKKKGAKIIPDKHCVLTSGHPSPLSANKGMWFGNGHFSKANNYLIATNQTPIHWGV